MKIGFLGGGKMAEAMIAALIRRGTWKRTRSSSAMSARHGGAVLKARSASTRTPRTGSFPFSGVVVLAVKPQNLGGILAELAFDVDRRSPGDFDRGGQAHGVPRVACRGPASSGRCRTWPARCSRA